MPIDDGAERRIDDTEEAIEGAANVKAAEQLTRRSMATEHDQGSKCREPCDAVGVASHTGPKGVQLFTEVTV
jgi:hypothetical protein